MYTKKPILSILLLATLVFALAGKVYAQGSQVMNLALDLFKNDRYLPALDLLEAEEANNKADFNYWLYLGLAYQRTSQLTKALNAYEKASKLNPHAKNIESRIDSIKNLINKVDKAQDKDYKSGSEKATWLFQQAQAVAREKKEDKAFKIFIQAVEYDVKLLSNDKDFVRRGVVYYKLKTQEKAEFAKLYYAIFKYFEGDIAAAYKSIKAFKEDSTPRTLTVQSIENHYYKLLAEANNQLKDLEQAEKEEKRQQILLAKSEKEAKKAKVEAKNANKTAEDSNNQSLDELESEIEEGNSFYRDDISFNSKFINALVEGKVKDYYAASDYKTKKTLLWEICQTGSQLPEAIDVAIDAINSNEGIDMLINATDGIRRIGMPSASKAIPTLISILDSNRADYRKIAIDVISSLKAQPETIVPKVLTKYAEEDNEFLKELYTKCIKNYDKVGLDIAYATLKETPRLERQPIAEVISAITGEKVEELINH